MQAEILIDFLTFTYHGTKKPDPYHAIMNILDMDIEPFEHTNKGVNFYQKSLHYNNIRVLYDGVHGDKMGICINMSGQGCRTYEEYHGNSIMILLEKIAKSPDINITRIDIACDDKTGLLNLSQMWQYANDGNYRTRLIKRNNYESFDGKNAGAKTIYFGSRSSQYFIRIYDKAAQQSNVSMEANQALAHWIRFEISLKGDYAVQAAGFLVLSESMNKSIGEVVSGIINAKFAFIEPDNENISRCSVAKWWTKFLGNIHDVEFLSKQKYNHGIDEHKKWLRESCGRVIAKVFYAIGEERFFKEILEYGNHKLSVADVAMVRDYQQREEQKNEH